MFLRIRSRKQIDYVTGEYGANISLNWYLFLLDFIDFQIRREEKINIKFLALFSWLHWEILRDVQDSSPWSSLYCFAKWYSAWHSQFFFLLMQGHFVTFVHVRLSLIQYPYIVWAYLLSFLYKDALSLRGLAFKLQVIHIFHKLMQLITQKSTWYPKTCTYMFLLQISDKTVKWKSQVKI